MKSFVIILAVGACTALGPMPATTAVSAVPSGPGAEAQVGFVPGFYLSRSAQDKAGGTAISELGAQVDPDRWLGLPGLILGARIFGQGGDTPGEPIVGYRHALGDDVSIAGVAYGAGKTSTSKLASYHGAQYGGELALDARMIDIASWLALHVQTAASATRVVGSGTYCADGSGDAVDCNVENPSANHVIDGRVSGVYPAATFTIAADFFRQRDSVLHGVRLAALVAAGEMPLAQNGVQQAAQMYVTGGLTLTLGFGASR